MIFFLQMGYLENFARYLENFSGYLELLGGNSGNIFRRFYMIFVSRPNGNDDDNDVSGSQIMPTPKLKELVQFICGHPHLPKDGQPIKVRFTRSSLPDPESCFNIIKLPLAHPDYNVFKRAMHVAINCQHQGYGRG